MKRIALFGGSFDPIHLGHLSIIEALVHSKQYEHIFVIPCGSHAFQKKFLFTSKERLDFLRASLSELSTVEVSEIEISTAQASYSIDTILHFKEKYPATKLVFVLGTDAFSKLDQWHRVDELVQLCQFVVIKRKDDLLQIPVIAGLNYELIDINAPQISSTKIREQIAKKGSLKGLVHPFVEEQLKSTTQRAN